MGAKSGQDELCGSYHSTLVFSHVIPTCMQSLRVKAWNMHGWTEWLVTLEKMAWAFTYRVT